MGFTAVPPTRKSPRLAKSPPRRYASPKREPAAKATPKAKNGRAKNGKAPQKSDTAFWHSIGIYLACLCVLAAMWAYVLSNAPPAPAGKCDGIGFYTLIKEGKDPATLVRLIGCAQAYQAHNEWFVVCMFMLTYCGIKMFAIPAVFPLGILGGAIFPFWLTLSLTGLGEACGNSLCYLMSRSIMQPVLERLFPQKLAKVAQKADEEKEHWLLFNFFLRLTPFVPNWFVNLSSPIVGNPIKPFFIGSLFGTQFSLLFLAICGNTLAEVGTQAYSDLRSPAALLADPMKYAPILIVGALGASAQVVPVYIIRKRKQAAGKRD